MHESAGHFTMRPRVRLNDRELASQPVADKPHDHADALPRLAPPKRAAPACAAIGSPHMSYGGLGSGDDAWTRSTVMVRVGRRRRSARSEQLDRNFMRSRQAMLCRT